MNLKPMLLLAAVSLTLAGCETQEKARQRNEDRLPPGCKIIDMDYGDLRVAVVCEGRKTSTSARGWDEVQFYWDDNLKTMQQYTVHHSRITAEIMAHQ